MASVAFWFAVVRRALSCSRPISVLHVNARACSHVSLLSLTSLFVSCCSLHFSLAPIRCRSRSRDDGLAYGNREMVKIQNISVLTRPHQHRAHNAFYWIVYVYDLMWVRTKRASELMKQRRNIAQWKPRRAKMSVIRTCMCCQHY